METILTKTRLLPAEDWARITPLRVDEQRRALAALLTGRAPFSYRPLRKHFGDLLGLNYRLMHVDDPPLTEVIREISKSARAGDERDANTALARLIYESLRSEGFAALAENFQRLSLGLGLTLGYCADAIFTRADETCVIAFNLRRTPFSEAAVRWVFSVMHEQSRALNADLTNARLAIVQFPQPKGSDRHATVRFGDGVPLYTYDELAVLAAQTQRLWVEAQEMAAALKRRSGTGDEGGWWGTDSGVG